jgi:hypothetical protein
LKKKNIFNFVKIWVKARKKLKKFENMRAFKNLAKISASNKTIDRFLKLHMIEVNKKNMLFHNLHNPTKSIYI